MISELEDEIEIKKKFITFKNPITNQIVSQIEMPNFIKLTSLIVCDLTQLRSKLKMLYIDVLCRGFHPLKRLEPQARNIFKNDSHDLHHCKSIQISNNQAVGTIWRCLARQIGRPLKNYQMNLLQQELFKEIQNLKNNSDFTSFQKLKIKGTSHQKAYEHIIKNIKEKEKEILAKFLNLTQKYHKEQQKQKILNKKIANLIEQQIIALEHCIFQKTLVGIRQHQQNQQFVELLMEQPYPKIIVPQKKAVQMLGFPKFMQKWKQYQQYVKNFSLQQQAIIVCHRCLTPLDGLSKIIGCNDAQAVLNIGHNLLTSPYLFHRQIINQNCWDQDPRRYIHPYLTFYPLDDQKTAVCNRFYCNKCEGFETGLDRNGNCSYCDGICDCIRCQSMDLLTKMMAVFVDYGGDLEKTVENFWMKFESEKLDIKHKKIVKGTKQTLAEMKNYLDNFYESKIILRKKDFSSQNFLYEKTFYFSSQINKEQKQTFKKYKMEKLDLSESNADKKERKLKQLQQKEEIKRINELILHKNDETAGENEFNNATIFEEDSDA